MSSTIQPKLDPRLTETDVWTLHGMMVEGAKDEAKAFLILRGCADLAEAVDGYRGPLPPTILYPKKT